MKIKVYKKNRFLLFLFIFSIVFCTNNRSEIVDLKIDDKPIIDNFIKLEEYKIDPCKNVGAKSEEELCFYRNESLFGALPENMNISKDLSHIKEIIISNGTVYTAILNMDKNSISDFFNETIDILKKNQNKSFPFENFRFYKIRYKEIDWYVVYYFSDHEDMSQNRYSYDIYGFKNKGLLITAFFEKEEIYSIGQIIKTGFHYLKSEIE